MDKRFDLGKAIVAGLNASAAYLGMQAIDTRLIDYPGDDLRLLGMLVTRRDPWWKMTGLAAHFTNGTLLALAYAALARNRLPGPPVVRGLLLGQVENALLWPVIPLVIDRIHPAVRSGAIPSYGNARYFTQEVLRHLAYGAVLGYLYG